MPETVYPMMRLQRRRRRGRWSRPTLRRPQLLAIAVLGLTLIVVAALLLWPRGSPDPARAFDDARHAIARGNYSAARRSAQTAVASRSSSAAAHMMLARADLLLGEGLAAEAELTRATDTGLPAARIRGARAQARLLQGDVDGAMAEAAQAPAGDVFAVRAHAGALAAKGRPDQAEALLDRALMVRPRNAALLTDLGRVRLSAGDVGGAATIAARAAAAGKRDPAALTLQGEVIRRRYGLIAALPWFEAALKLDAYFHPALIEYAATLGDAGRYAEMLAATRKALATRPGSPQALYLQATLAARAGQGKLARSLLQQAGNVDRTLSGAMLLDAGLDYADGRDEQAIETWRRLVMGQPMNLIARRLLATALLRSGDAQGAIDLLRPMAVRDDATSYTLVIYARALEATGDRAAAGNFLDRAQSGRRGSSGVFGIDGTLDSFAAAAALAPSDPGLVIGLIRARIDTGDATGAIDRAQALAIAAPGAPAAQLALGDALIGAGRTGDAVVAYSRAADLSFDEPTMLRMVDAMGQAGRARDAAATLSLYLRQNPQSVVGQRIRAHWLVSSGQGGAAIEPLEAIRRMIGNRDAALLTDLALAYAAAGDGAIAERYARAAYALAPMNVAVVDAYGVALAADQRVDDARQLFAKARAIDPGNRVVADHLRQISR